MYKIFANGKLIFDDHLPDEDLLLVNPKLILEDNEPGTLDFTLPLAHRYANEKNDFGRPFCGSKTDTLTVYKNNKWIWEGRPASETSDFYNRRQIHCEGALSYLSDTIQPLASQIASTNLNTCVREFLEKLLDTHNKQLKEIGKKTGVDLSNRMIFIEDGESIINVTPKDISTFTRITNYETTLESINKRLINKLEGHIRIRRNSKGDKLILDYFKDCLNTSSQKIEFGKNLLDYNKSTDLTEIATVVIPRGDTVEENSPFYRSASVFSDIQQRVHLGWLNTLSNGTPAGDQRIYADSNIIKEFGYIEKIVEFENIEAKIGYESNGWTSIDAYRNSTNVVSEDNSKYKMAYLRALEILGKDYISNLQFDKLELELTIFDLNYLGLDNAQELNLLDNVICSSVPHGMINKAFPLKKIDISLDSPDDTKITLGDSSYKSISATAGVSASTIDEDPGDYNNYYKGLLLKAKYQADAIMTQSNNGYITISQKSVDDDSKYSDSMIISSERLLPYESKTIASLRKTHPSMKLWLWNVNGLGYYDFSKSNSKLVTALTSDGQIVADAITTGTLTSIEIYGCNLTLGTKNNKTGTLTVNTTSGTFTINSSGLTCKNSSNYYLNILNGKLYGGQNSTQYGYIDATASITDYEESGNPTYNGIKINGNVIALDTLHLVVKNPDTSKYGGREFVNCATVTLKNVEFSVNGGSDYIYGDLTFIEGLLVGYPDDVIE